MRSRLRSLTEGIGAGLQDTSTAFPANEAMPGIHFAAQRAAHGQSFGHSGACCLCGGQHSIGLAVEDMPVIPAMPMPPIFIGPASTIDAIAAGASARANGVTIGADRKPIAAKSDKIRMMRIDAFTTYR